MRISRHIIGLMMPVFLFSSCTSSLNLLVHMQVRNPKVMTEQACLDYARANLREGIQDVYVIPCEPNDSAREQAMAAYFDMDERVFGADGLEYDALDTTLTCRWNRFGLLAHQDSINRYFRQTDKAQSLDECLRSYKPLAISDKTTKYPVTFVLGLSPDNGKMNLTPKDINQLYDAWEGRCRIIVVITNPLDTWGLSPGKRIKYKMTLSNRDERSAQATMSFSF